MLLAAGDDLISMLERSAILFVKSFSSITDAATIPLEEVVNGASA
tara:strand:+ start:361 stop:495 length:135 start_codon:yes stop_codon:yes gene_type:complete